MNSAAIYWQTDGRAWGYVEYGKTKEYGAKTAARDKPSFAQLHHLSGLEANVEFHYRIVSVGVDGKQVASEDKMFTTKKPEGKVILWPDEMPDKKRAYKLHQGDTTYVLTRSTSTCFRPISGSNMTIDLNGHTLEFGGGMKARVVMGPKGRFTICNGIVRDVSTINGVLSFRLPGVTQMEAFGMTINATGGIHNYRGPANLHHNRISHPVRIKIGGAAAIYRKGGASKIYHNIFPNASTGTTWTACHNAEIYENVFELETWAVGKGLGLNGKGNKIYNNKFIARGEAPWALTGFGDNRITGNKIDLMVDTYPRGKGTPPGAVGLKLDESAKGLEFNDNTVVVRGALNPEFGAGGNAYGIWFGSVDPSAVSIKDNTIVTVPGAPGAKAVSVTTDGKDGGPEPVVKNNQVVTAAK